MADLPVNGAESGIHQLREENRRLLAENLLLKKSLASLLCEQIVLDSGYLLRRAESLPSFAELVADMAKEDA